MKKMMVLVLIAGLLVIAGIAQAQETSTTQQTTTTTTTERDANTTAGDTHSNVRTLTGCIQKGEDANEYDLVGQDGSTWELKSDAVDLAPHLGHTVTITGAVAHPTMHGMKEDTKKEAQEHGMDKSATEHGHLTVTNLSMVSSSCSK
jgi:hypothetical protein